MVSATEASTAPPRVAPTAQPTKGETLLVPLLLPLSAPLLGSAGTADAVGDDDSCGSKSCKVAHWGCTRSALSNNAGVPKPSAGARPGVNARLVRAFEEQSKLSVASCRLIAAEVAMTASTAPDCAAAARSTRVFTRHPAASAATCSTRKLRVSLVTSDTLDAVTAHAGTPNENAMNAAKLARTSGVNCAGRKLRDATNSDSAWLAGAVGTGDGVSVGDCAALRTADAEAAADTLALTLATNDEESAEVVVGRTVELALAAGDAEGVKVWRQLSERIRLADAETLPRILTDMLRDAVTLALADKEAMTDTDRTLLNDALPLPQVDADALEDGDGDAEARALTDGDTEAIALNDGDGLSETVAHVLAQADGEQVRFRFTESSVAVYEELHIHNPEPFAKQ